MDTFEITASALTAQRVRLDAISSNLANVNTTRNADGTIGAYRRKNVVFAPILNEQMGSLPPTGSHSDRGDINLIPTSSGNSLTAEGGQILKARISKQSFDNGIGVQVAEIKDDTDAPLKRVFDPSHPDADDEGYVEMPNVNVVSEMVDMISASRAYEANVTALQSAKTMANAALEI